MQPGSLLRPVLLAGASFGPQTLEGAGDSLCPAGWLDRPLPGRIGLRARPETGGHRCVIPHGSSSRSATEGLLPCLGGAGSSSPAHGLKFLQHSILCSKIPANSPSTNCGVPAREDGASPSPGKGILHPINPDLPAPPALCRAHRASPATLHLTDPDYSARGKVNQGDLCCGRSQRLYSGPV